MPEKNSGLVNVTVDAGSNPATGQVSYGVILGFHGADQHAKRIFSFNDDPDRAIRNARHFKESSKFLYALIVEGRRIVE